MDRLKEKKLKYLLRYNADASTIVKEVGLSLEEAKLKIEEFREAYPELTKLFRK